MHEVEKDERTISVENASYRVAYLFVVFAILVDVGFRAYFYGQAAWELLGLVVMSGALTVGLQARQKVLTRRWGAMVLITVIVAALVASIIAFVRL